jgi:hypothetical protein
MNFQPGEVAMAEAEIGDYVVEATALYVADKNNMPSHQVGKTFWGIPLRYGSPGVVRCAKEQALNWRHCGIAKSRVEANHSFNVLPGSAPSFSGRGNTAIFLSVLCRVPGQNWDALPCTH